VRNESWRVSYETHALPGSRKASGWKKRTERAFRLLGTLISTDPSGVIGGVPITGPSGYRATPHARVFSLWEGFPVTYLGIVFWHIG
jgi:hypothetical protein